MSESAVAATAACPIAAAPAEKKGAAKTTTEAKKPSTEPPHPQTQQLVDTAIKNLQERGGASLLFINKYISATYKSDAQKLAPFIKKCIKSAVASGKLVQTKSKE